MTTISTTIPCCARRTIRSPGSAKKPLVGLPRLCETLFLPSRGSGFVRCRSRITTSAWVLPNRHSYRAERRSTQGSRRTSPTLHPEPHRGSASSEFRRCGSCVFKNRTWPEPDSARETVPVQLVDATPDNTDPREPICHLGADAYTFAVCVHPGMLPDPRAQPGCGCSLRS